LPDTYTFAAQTAPILAQIGGALAELFFRISRNVYHFVLKVFGVPYCYGALCTAFASLGKFPVLIACIRFRRLFDILQLLYRLYLLLQLYYNFIEHLELL
jgi:hypothetical protein